MSSSNDRYFPTYSKSRRSSPDHSQGGFFQTGQGGRTVLPPLSSAFPTSRFPGPAYPSQFTPRSSPARYEVNPHMLYHYSSPEPTPSFSMYETQERYPTPPQGYSFTSRTPPVPSAQPDNRKLPPLATNTSAGWTTSYLQIPSNYQTGGGSSSGIRSPMASYPTTYAYPPTTQGGTYTYMPVQEPTNIQIPSMNTTTQISSYEVVDTSRGDYHRPASPYNRTASQVVAAPVYSPPPVSPTSPEEPTIKKKRKRADARQLKVLNETYNRTAFPSTEERLALAKELDMSARSVQIWFQNKRQSMRQTNRQSSTAGSSSQPYTTTGQDGYEDYDHSQMPYNNATPAAAIEAQYPSRHSPEASRSHSSHRRVRQNDETTEHRKQWY
ncbi:putative homeodomain containing protein [Lyophyllum shimeji]|uniref:Homeodomain containing protein n=1 Tax=Lyophyllum shimeji TaxID=47721 RepID=A0A9P3PK07_LYOSH|nr:putative homeodomain containing protein [Lyophyllum shimeji]